MYSRKDSEKCGQWKNGIRNRTIADDLGKFALFFTDLSHNECKLYNYFYFSPQLSNEVGQPELHIL